MCAFIFLDTLIIFTNMNKNYQEQLPLFTFEKDNKCEL